MNGLWVVLKDAATLMLITPTLRKAFAYGHPGDDATDMRVVAESILRHVEHLTRLVQEEDEFLHRVRKLLDIPLRTAAQTRAEIFEFLSIAAGSVLPVGFDNDTRIIVSRMGPFSGERMLPDELVLCSCRGHDKDPVEQRYVKAPS